MHFHDVIPVQCCRLRSATAMLTGNHSLFLLFGQTGEIAEYANCLGRSVSVCRFHAG